ncbi:MAG: hypothetical protein GQ526_06555 [Ardenticatenales bacterium]|nr:hypothetical protein [Ardenticatenales bacterium]
MEAFPAVPRRSDIIRAFQERGNSVAAVFPIHYPRALFRAFHVLPVEVWGPPEMDPSVGAAHLQPYVCSIVQNAISFLQTGGLDVADFLVVPHTCDSLQGLASIWIDLVCPKQPVLPIYLPRGRRESDIDFLTEELRSVHCRLEGLTGRSPSDGELLACVRREEAADALLSKLRRRRATLPLADTSYYRLVRSREYLPAETFIELARSRLERADPGARVSVKAPIILSGIVPEPLSLLQAISEMGGGIVADDLACCGRRLYPPGKSEQPFRRMAERILHASPDPTRGSPIQSRLKHLLRLAESSRANGVVFYEIKFCEPELFDLPDLRRGLQEAGIPSVTVEVDINDPLSHRTLTRVGAFLEMIQ